MTNSRRAPFPKIKIAEFFAGVGLVRMAVESEDCRVIFANDIDIVKRSIYTANFSAEDFICRDVREVTGGDVPTADIATASFPCIDLSLAGNRAGLAGRESGLFWEFVRVLREMGKRAPRALLIENVPGFATSNGGDDLDAAVAALNRLDYSCDLLVLDARRFITQSRLRLFIVGSKIPIPDPFPLTADDLRPDWLCKFAQRRGSLRLHGVSLPLPPREADSKLQQILEELPSDSGVWWDRARLRAFLQSLSPLQAARLAIRRDSRQVSWATAYRRTRAGKPVWEIRADGIAGCLRTTRGGSSKQAIIKMGRGRVSARWMTAREYARLQGAPRLRFGSATESQARFALGDAVCVPVVAWLTRHYLIPLVQGILIERRRAYA
jgi:DNA (cytosine-5)-methyltransferase 1